MSADFWMGIAIGSVGPWILMIMAFCVSGKGAAKTREYNERLHGLMEARNKLDEKKVQALYLLVARKRDEDEGRAAL